MVFAHCAIQFERFRTRGLGYLLVPPAILHDHTKNVSNMFGPRKGPPWAGHFSKLNWTNPSLIVALAVRPGRLAIPAPWQTFPASPPPPPASLGPARREVIRVGVCTIKGARILPAYLLRSCSICSQVTHLHQCRVGYAESHLLKKKLMTAESHLLRPCSQVTYLYHRKVGDAVPHTRP